MYKHNTAQQRLVTSVANDSILVEAGGEWPSLVGMKVKVLVAQFCPTLWDPMDCGPPASSVHGILQARILEW